MNDNNLNNNGTTVTVDNNVQNNIGGNGQVGVQELMPEVGTTPIQPDNTVNPIKFSGDSQVIFEAKPEKESSPLAVIIIIIIFIAFIFFLPEIKNLIGDKVDWGSPTNNGNTSKEQPKDDPIIVEEPQDELQLLSNNQSKVVIDNLRIWNVTIDKIGKKFLFTIKNESSETFTFNKKYYLILYDDDENVLYTALIQSYDYLAATTSKEYAVNVSDKALLATKYMVKEIKDVEYSNYEPNTEGDYQVISCNFNSNSIKYYFMNNLLTRIEDNYEEQDKGDSLYDESLNKYKLLNEEYQKVDGIESYFTEMENYFTLKNELDLAKISNVNLGNLKVYRYFKYNEVPKVVYFEMSSLGYTCE